jgi:hypothetical protein
MSKIFKSILLLFTFSSINIEGADAQQLLDLNLPDPPPLMIERSARSSASLVPNSELTCAESMKITLLFREVVNFNSSLLVRLNYLPISTLEQFRLTSKIEDEISKLSDESQEEADGEIVIDINRQLHPIRTNLQQSRFDVLAAKYSFLQDPKAYYDNNNIYNSDVIDWSRDSGIFGGFEVIKNLKTFGTSMPFIRASEACSRQMNRKACMFEYQNQVFSLPESVKIKDYIELEMTQAIDLVLPAATQSEIYLDDYIADIVCIGGRAQLDLVDVKLLLPPSE